MRSRDVKRLRALVAIVASVPIVAGGVGWLHLLSHVVALDIGPLVPGALPLQRLAGKEAQPLARVLLSWIGTGLVLGIVLAAVGGLERRSRALTAGAIGVVALAGLSALQDAVTASESVSGHLLPQLTRPGLWIAITVMVGCVLVSPRRGGPMRR